jgi:hypothetical protein
MGFPIVLGNKSVASRLIATAQPIEEFDDDGTILLPLAPSRPAIIVATSPAQELLAWIAIYFYDMCRSDNGEIAFSTAEVHVQISLLAQPTSISGRDTLFRIRLPLTRRGSVPTVDTDHRATTTHTAIFSSDNRYLTCLISHPNGSDSFIVVFQLRKPKEPPHTNNQMPPLPTYISPSAITPPVIPIATNPRILSRKIEVAGGASETPLLNATAICDVETTVGPNLSCVLLVGCQDGSILVATYRPLLSSGLLYMRSDNRNIVTHRTSPAVVEMDHLTEWLDIHDKTLVGRLAVVFGDGSVLVFRSHIAENLADENESTPRLDNYLDRSSVTIRSFHSTTSSIATTSPVADFAFSLTPTHDLLDCGDNIPSGSNMFISVKWIAGSYLAALEVPSAECTVHVVGVYDYGRCSPISTMVLTRNQLEESSNSTFQMGSGSLERQEESNYVTAEDQNQRNFSLQYDAHSDCIAISSFLQNNGNHPDCHKHRFISIWSWRMNVRGFTAILALGASPDSIKQSTLYFAVDPANKRKIVHVTTSYNSSLCSIRFHKETYHVVIFSPPYEFGSNRYKIREATSLLLSGASVSYPLCTKSSTLEHFEMEWMESPIPKPYLSAFGAPFLATMGKNSGRFVAVASNRGFCVLDRTGADRSNDRLLVADSVPLCTSAQLSQDESLMKFLRSGSASPKWRLFANETNEKAFRVVAMTWWEGVVDKPDVTAACAQTDDLLVVIIEVLEGHELNGYYLSCWSGKDVELTSQLLGSAPSRFSDLKGTKWGIELPPGFFPGCLDLLACPLTESSRDLPTAQPERIAAVLLADCSHSTFYRIYQLKVVTSDSEAKASGQYKVICRCTAYGSVGCPAELFLASSSYSFPCNGSDDENDESVAVMGVLRKYGGGLDAFSVRSSSIVGVGQVIESADNNSDEPFLSEISRYWLSDTVMERKLDDKYPSVSFFVWIIQLACGRLVNWSVPFLWSIHELNFLSEPSLAFTISENDIAATTVHPKGISLGLVYPAGNASSWMQQSALGTQCEFLGGHIPKSSHGCVVGVAQSVRNIHTLLDEKVDIQSFRLNFLDHEVLRPSDCRLYPPGYLPSLYVLAIETASSTQNFTRHYEQFEQQLRQKLSIVAFQDTAVASVQLIVLRLVEKLAAISKHRMSDSGHKYSRLVDILATVVASIRHLTTPLQFATFFITLGRQLEPSCLPYLFPLPETLDDLFHLAVACGSIQTSVSTIPLLLDNKSSLSKCTSVFHFCINKLDTNFTFGISYDFDVCQEELDATGDVFRYALKIQYRAPEDRRLLYRDFDNERHIPASSFATICSVTNIFGRSNETRTYVDSRKNEETPLLVHGMSDSRIIKLKEYGVNHIRKLTLWQNLNCIKFKTVPEITSRYVVSSIFGGDLYDSRIGWTKVGALSTILIHDSTKECCYCSIDKFAELIRDTKMHRFTSLVPLDIRRKGITSVLTYCIDNCNEAIEADLCGCIFDLILVLLGSNSSSFQAEIPGLILIAITAGHVSGRISDILSQDSMGELPASYFELFST